MAFTASTVTGRSSKKNSYADRSSPFTNDHNMFVCFWGQYQSMSRTPLVPSMTTSSGICDSSMVLAITCSPISRTDLALLQPCYLKYAVRPCVPTCPLFSKSLASSVSHAMIFKSDSICRSVRLWIVRVLMVVHHHPSR